MTPSRETWTHHAVTINGRVSNEINDTLDNARDRLRRMLARLDGKDRYSLMLWKRPPRKRLDEVDEATDVVEYIQCAGSSQAMTVEIRTGLGDEARQYVVGRSPEHEGGPDVAVPWNGYVATVYPDEVFNADEAAELFGSYLASGSIPPGFAQRLLDLDAAPST